MNQSIQNPVALITGASRGLGRALAHQFASDNYQLILIARNQSELETLKLEIEQNYQTKVSVFSVDLANSEVLRQRLEQIESEFEQIDVLINNAGTGHYQPFLEQAFEDIERTIAVNLSAPILITHRIAKVMVQQRGGQIINIGSDLAQRPLANMTPYVASKHGLQGFTDSLIRELKSQKVKLTMVNTGMIDTHFGGAKPQGYDGREKLVPEQLAKLISQIVHQPEYQLIDQVTAHPIDQDY